MEIQKEKKERKKSYINHQGEDNGGTRMSLTEEMNFPI